LYKAEAARKVFFRDSLQRQLPVMTDKGQLARRILSIDQ
jgi:hypothetical protein